MISPHHYKWSSSHPSKKIRGLFLQQLRQKWRRNKLKMNLKKPYFLVCFKGQEKPPKLQGISKTIRRGIDLFRSWIQYKNKGYFFICILFWSKNKRASKIDKWGYTGDDKACILWEVLSSFWGTFSRNFSQKNNTDIVNKVILGGLHWWALHLRYTLVSYTGNKYG